MNGFRCAACLRNGLGSDETHVIKIEEITCQWGVLGPELSHINDSPIPFTGPSHPYSNSFRICPNVNNEDIEVVPPCNTQVTGEYIFETLFKCTLYTPTHSLLLSNCE